MIIHTAWPTISAGETVVVEHRIDGWSRAVTIAEVLPALPGAGEGIVTTSGSVYQHFFFQLTPTQGDDDQALVDAVFDRLALELASDQ